MNPLILLLCAFAAGGAVATIVVGRRLDGALGSFGTRLVTLVVSAFVLYVAYQECQKSTLPGGGNAALIVAGATFVAMMWLKVRLLRRDRLAYEAR